MKDQETIHRKISDESDEKPYKTPENFRKKLTEIDKEAIRKDKLEKYLKHPHYLNLQEGSQVFFSFLINSHNYYTQPNNLIVPTNITSSFSSENDFIQHLFGQNMQYQYKLKVEYDIHSPLLKDRAFSLRAGIFDFQDNEVILSDPMQFTAALYTDDIPLRHLVNTQHNEKIITGTTVVETSGKICFRKLTIREVSSYYTNRVFHLVIIPEDFNKIKPLAIMNIKVKSRNIKLWKLKKTKTGE